MDKSPHAQTTAHGSRLCHTYTQACTCTCRHACTTTAAAPVMHVVPSVSTYTTQHAQAVRCTHDITIRAPHRFWRSAAHGGNRKENVVQRHVVVTSHATYHNPVASHGICNPLHPE